MVIVLLINAQNISFRKYFWWPIYIINSVDKPNILYTPTDAVL